MTNIALVYRRHGGPERLEEISLPNPSLRPRTLLIQVTSIGLNPLDYRLLRGEMGPLARLNGPRLIGSDFAGHVIKVGPLVSGYAEGDRVFGMVNQVFSGTSAHRIVVHVRHLSRSPSALSDAVASTVPLAALTAYQALHNIVQLGPETRVLINGASGGVGTYATQFASLAGSRCTAVTSYRNTSWMPELGADRVIDYTKSDFTAENESYDVVFDCYGNRRFNEVRKVLTDKGVYITTIPAAKQFMASLPNPLRGQKNKVVLVRSRTQDLGRIAEMINAEQLTPIVDEIFHRSDINAAYEKLLTKRARGKIAVMM